MDRKKTKPASRVPKRSASKPAGKVGTAVPVRKHRKKPAQPPRPQRPEPEIVYTPPKPFNRNRLLLQLGIVAAVVLAVFFSLNMFFKVSDITVDNRGSDDQAASQAGADHQSGVQDVYVSGNGRYSAQTVAEASGIRIGDGLLGLNKAQIASRIITELPYVKSVRIGIKLPGTVNIEIEELDVVYAIAEAGGSWWLMNSAGKLVEKTDAAAASEYTRIWGVELDRPVVGEQAVAREEAPEETTADGMTQPVTITNGQRLQTALTIAQYLEDKDVMGAVVSIDASDMGNVKLQYGQRFQIHLGDTTQLAYKIEMALAAVSQLAEHERGTVDVSFIVRQEVIYTPRAD